MRKVPNECAGSTDRCGCPRPFGWSLHDGFVVAKRNLLQIPRVPELLFFSLVQPVIFVLLFSHVFGGAIPVPGGGSYREYLIPGVFGQTVAFAAAGVTVGLSEDMHKGIIDRFRSLPMASSGVLLGRSLADLVRTVLVLVVLTLAGLLVGWRINSSIGEALAGYGILLLFGYAMIWVGAWVGLHAEPGGRQHRRPGVVVPAHLPLQRLRSHRRHARLAAGRRGMESISAVVLSARGSSATRPASRETPSR